MQIIPRKTIRFAELVKTLGPPHLKTLWSNPDDDAELGRRLQENRVVTVRPANTGTKKDFGMIGFFPEKKASYLIFPKRIKSPPGVKVVGIKYDLLVQPKVSNPIDPSKLRKSRDTKKSPKAPNLIFEDKELDVGNETTADSSTPPASKKDPQLRNYRVTLAIVARAETMVKVQALNKSMAEKKARESRPDFDPSRASFKYQVVKVIEGGE